MHLENAPEGCLLEYETLLGMEHPNQSEVQVRREITEGTSRFYLENRTEPHLQYHSSAKKVLLPMFQPMYNKFLLYECVIHPKVRKQVEQDGRIPLLISYLYKIGDVTQIRTLKLKRCDEVISIEHPNSVINHLTKQYCDDKQLNDVIEKTLMTPTEQSWSKLLSTTRKFVEGALRNNRPLDGYLASYEYILQTGDLESGMQLKEQCLSNHPDDQNVTTLINALQHMEQNDPARAIQLFDSIDKAFLIKAYIINVYKAVAMTSISQETSCFLLMRTLDLNPLLTEVYCMLASMYVVQNNHSNCWACWRAAKHINPHHYMLQKVFEVENSYISKHPQFF
jgi:hypothetical protein